MAATLVHLLSIIFCLIFQFSNALTPDYYLQTCPKAEATITRAVRRSIIKDKTAPAALLRLHFHDCFIRGCDASVLLDSKGNNKAEKDGPPNISLHAYYVIDNAKKELETMCPGVVSCADILAVAARDAVALSGGPTWDVPKGRKDGRVSKANDSLQLPFPTFSISQLQQSFSKRGLSLDDLVVLSGSGARGSNIFKTTSYMNLELKSSAPATGTGGHTLGFSHCSSFQNRIHSFNNATDVDPSMSPSFAASLRRICPMHNKVKNAGANLDFTPNSFDNVYYKLLLKGKSIFSSDQALLAASRTKALVAKFATYEKEFFDAFAKSMIKMSSIDGGGTEIRLNCGFVN
ncbi:Peroxidase 64 [Salvia divinorum]|uniref:Peroxidase n=1 Tax=Salvia divinorum TaxID=28513 RepID=A0ABD1FNE3_SALDI